MPMSRPRIHACGSFGRRTMDAYRPPAGDAHARPCRPRPATCRSAQTTRPSSMSASRSSFAVSFVDSRTSWWRTVRPTTFRFESWNSPSFTGDGPVGRYFNVRGSGGNLRGGRRARLDDVLAREEAPEHHGDPEQLADVERPRERQAGEGASRRDDERPYPNREVEPQPRPPVRVDRDTAQGDAPRDREEIRERANVPVGDCRPGDREGQG